jgi:hypothetical protein
MASILRLAMSRASNREKNVIEGRYSNFFKIGHNAFEFVLEFGQRYAEAEETRLHTRVITSPSYAKELLRTMMDSIKRYESVFGEIREP